LARDAALHDQVAFVVGRAIGIRVGRARALHEQVQARVDDGAVRRGERDLLADDRREVGLHREDEVD
jgi:hypothetical protein